jgi:hypothetical protein
LQAVVPPGLKAVDQFAAGQRLAGGLLEHDQQLAGGRGQLRQAGVGGGGVAGELLYPGAVGARDVVDRGERQRQGALVGIDVDGDLVGAVQVAAAVLLHQ